MADNALIYLRISLLGLPATLVILAGHRLPPRPAEHPHPAGRRASARPSSNLVLEVVLIYGLGFGIGASALSTVVAEMAAAAVYVG